MTCKLKNILLSALGYFTYLHDVVSNNHQHVAQQSTTNAGNILKRIGVHFDIKIELHKEIFDYDTHKHFLLSLNIDLFFELILTSVSLIALNVC